jgi:hypothetical protein
LTTRIGRSVKVQSSKLKVQNPDVKFWIPSPRRFGYFSNMHYMGAWMKRLDAARAKAVKAVS